MDIPTISIVIPTLNSEKVLEPCLEAIRRQDYPKENVEVIVVDGGSVDRTLEVAKRYQVDKILENPLKTGEAGKAVGVRYSEDEIVAFVDSDNILPDTDWLRRMVEPFDDPEIVCGEPIAFTYREEDSYVTRYCALVGVNDPLCLFMGNYDKYNDLTRRWTEMPVMEEDKGNYIKIKLLDEKKLPTIGANGFLIRRDALLACSVKDYLFDIDVLWELISKNPKLRVAKVNVGIIHLFCSTISMFIRKQKRRIKDFIYFSKSDTRKYPWGDLDKIRLMKFVLYSTLFFPLLLQSLMGYLRKPDPAWFFHPLACWITLWVYGWGMVVGRFKQGPISRERWTQ